MTQGLGSGMRQYEFTHNGYECVITYNGRSLPDFLIDGQPVPSGVIREDDVEHIGDDIQWWKEQTKIWIDTTSFGESR